jgi:hypothetical protein
VLASALRWQEVAKECDCMRRPRADPKDSPSGRGSGRLTQWSGADLADLRFCRLLGKRGAVGGRSIVRSGIGFQRQVEDTLTRSGNILGRPLEKTTPAGWCEAALESNQLFYSARQRFLRVGGIRPERWTRSRSTTRRLHVNWKADRAATRRLRTGTCAGELVPLVC